MKISFLCASGIANKMATALQGVNEAECWAIASRDLSRAQEYAEKYGFKKAFGSYDELLNDPETELVYVSSPHNLHYAHVKMCLEHGKHVICEKPFTVNAKQAEELFTLAGKKNLFLTEAFWSRFIPGREKLVELIESKVLGEVKSVQAAMGYDLTSVQRLTDPNLAGGALLDVGVYALNFAAMVLGDQVEQTLSCVDMSEDGIDKQNAIILCYPEGRIAYIMSSMCSDMNIEGVVNCEHGYFECNNVYCWQEIKVCKKEGECIAVHKTPVRVNGYEYEVESSIRAITQGKLECPEMPHRETLRIMRQMDAIRAQWNMKYPCEC